MIAPRPLPTIELTWDNGPSLEEVTSREWLVTNGLGGYASGTLLGIPTRRYHGYFVPALPAPHGRTVVLARLTETVSDEHGSMRLDACEQLGGKVDAPALSALRAFRLHGLIPEWEYALAGGGRLRKRLVLVHGQNTVHVTYRNEGEHPFLLRLRPWWTFRMHETPLESSKRAEYPLVQLRGECLEVLLERDVPSVKTKIKAPMPAPFVGLPETSEPLLFRVERSRGYEHCEVQRSPGHHSCTLAPGETLSFSVSLGAWDELDLPAEAAFQYEIERQRALLERAGSLSADETGARLVLAADQFIIQPNARPGDETYARAHGQNARSVIAGYHWFTDWGRDTMISLEGLTLSTGRAPEAASILRTFCHHVRDGLLPNLFPEGGREGLYHTADATLWLFHAVNRHLRATADESLLRELFPVLDDIISHHLKGTKFGIGVDPRDGLLRQGAPGYQLTWMDAKVDGWVVTPRRGKAVEINALWYNALRLMAGWAERLGEKGQRFADAAERAQASFNQRFWNASAGCLYDVVDGENGDDPAIRPNQIFALSLDHPVLRQDLWPSVLKTVQEKLLTPVGLRTLSAEHPDYKPRYDGDLRARDAAYHQGTVWPWLLGHYVDAAKRVEGPDFRLEGLLQGLREHLLEACVGQVSEIFDATAPFHARGCAAQAWSVAEFLRVWQQLHAGDPR